MQVETFSRYASWNIIDGIFMVCEGNIFLQFVLYFSSHLEAHPRQTALLIDSTLRHPRLVLTQIRFSLLPSRAFNDVVADNQFASLGLVLLGLLARVYKIVGGGGSTASRGALCHEDEQRLLSADRAFELERGEQTEQIPGTLGLNAGHAQRLDTTKAAREQSPDFGEVVSRESLVSSMDTTC